ncbi:MAG: hypothetical protein MPEBLZ_03680, partial [Candidatus Methanoperedens nitroreducens]
HFIKTIGFATVFTTTFIYYDA